MCASTTRYSFCCDPYLNTYCLYPAYEFDNYYKQQLSYDHNVSICLCWCDRLAEQAATRARHYVGDGSFWATIFDALKLFTIKAREDFYAWGPHSCSLSRHPTSPSAPRQTDRLTTETRISLSHLIRTFVIVARYGCVAVWTPGHCWVREHQIICMVTWRLVRIWL